MAHIFAHSEKVLDINGNVVNIHHHVNSNTKVVGKITIPDAPQKHKCTCDECGCEVDDRFGDPRIKVEYFDSMDAKNPSSIRMICEWCA
jgi:hypothetical protein